MGSCSGCRFGLALLLTLALVGWPRSSYSSSAPKPSKSGCSVGQESALSELACEIKLGLRGLSRPAVVVGAPLNKDATAARPAALVGRLVSVVSGALGPDVRAGKSPADFEQARSRASGAKTLVYLRPTVRRGHLEVVADAYSTARTLWDRVRDLGHGPLHHAFSRRELDAELRTFMPTIPLVVTRIDKARLPRRYPVALACADVDGDTSSEILLVDRSRLYVGRLKAGGFLASEQAEWSTLAPVAPSPLRQPIGSAAASGDRWHVGLTDRATALELDASLRIVARWGAVMPWPPGGCTAAAAPYLSGTLTSCSKQEAARPDAGLGEPVDAVAGATLLTRRGILRRVRAARLGGRDTAVLFDDRGRRTEIASVGAQLAVGDLDTDGQPEIVSGGATLDPSKDVLRVHTWRDDGSVLERYQIPVPGGVRAVAVCPSDAEGVRPLAVATADEIWVLR